MSAYISLPMYSASIDERMRLIAGKCTSCGTLNYPPRQVCTHCGGTGFTPQPLSGYGRVYTFTVIARGGAPAEFDQQQTLTGEIMVGVVELDEGPRVVGQIVDASAGGLDIGTRVHGVVRRLYDQEGIIRYGVKFQPEADHG
ncbi:Zn-ribbon domain-containing OB-fold protein [Xanthobacter flavus]|uniref:Zn-ribbon domain-containing OB-fold protein n=1 Tax=Xanthobacter flavus TaxID=281 RepID=UPI0037265CD2